jgi:hypothetical protein
MISHAALVLALSLGAAGPLEQAAHLYDEGSFPQALAALDQAEAATTDDGVLAQAELLRAQCLAATGDQAGVERAFTSALAHNPEAALDASSAAPDLVQRLEKLRQKSQGELIVHADQPQARLRLDGHDPVSLPFQGRLTIGRHTLDVATPDGAFAQKQEVVLRPDRTYEVSVHLERQAPKVAAAPAVTAPATEVEAKPSHGATALLGPIGLGAAAVGVVGLGVGLGTALAERSTVAKMTDPASIQKYHGSAESLATASRITTGVGLGALVVGAVLVTVSMLSGPEAPAASTGQPALAYAF